MKKTGLLFIVFLSCIFYSACNNESAQQLAENNVVKDIIITTEECHQVSNEDYIFHCIDDSIIRENTKSSVKELFVNAADCIFGMQLCDDTLYYAVQSDENFNVYSIRVDDGESRTVFKEDEFSSEFRQDENVRKWEIYRKKLYIQTNYAFYSFDVNSRSFEKMHKDVWKYEIYDDNLYFIDHSNRTFTIYVMNLDTKKIEIVLGDGMYCSNPNIAKERYSNFVITDNGDLIYTKRDPLAIYYYNESNLLVEAGENIIEYTLASSGDNVYYVVQNDGSWNLISYNLDNKSHNVVTALNDFKNYSCITENYYFYVTSEGKLSKVKI